jgi:isoleucyl-tRNA synthetase
MAFTCDEVWQYLPSVTGKMESVHLATFPVAADLLGTSGTLGGTVEDKAEQEDWATLLQVREEVLKALETERANKIIGGGLEAQVKITLPDPAYSVLARHADQLRYLWIVSAASAEKTASANGSAAVSVHVSKADGLKCERCWNYSTHVGEDTAYPTVCERCSAALQEIKGSR